MPEKLVVGYDGSDVAKRAVNFAIATAAATGGSVVVAHVLEWSPFTFLTPTELEERHKRRQEEIERAETAIIAPLLAEIEDKGVSITSALKYGHIANMLIHIATENEATQLVIGRSGNSGTVERIFGSVAGSLAQTSPVPCTIVP